MATKNRMSTREVIERKRALFEVIEELLGSLDGTERYTKEWCESNISEWETFKAENPEVSETDWHIEKFARNDKLYRAKLSAIAEVRDLLDTLI